MPCLSLTELPAAPAGKSGWPWTEASSRIPDLMPDESPWPRISIVTPSYNQGKFIEETIRSVLLQGYPNLEYIIIDGGSTDGTVGIIEKYQPWLAFWISEKDEGQADAINKGLERATGEIANWLNSDDLLYIGALRRVAMCYCSDPTANLYNGAAVKIDSDGTFIAASPALPLLPEEVLEGGKIPLSQPAIFFRRGDWLRHGKLKKHLYYALDTDFIFSSLLFGHSRMISGAPLAMMRLHENAKTGSTSSNWNDIIHERYEILSQLNNNPSTPQHLLKYIRYGLTRESLRLARLSLTQKRSLYEMLVWLIRASVYSPVKTLRRFPHILAGQLYR